MKNSAFLLISLLTLPLLTACGKGGGTPDSSRGPALVEVAGKFLHAADVAAVIPPGCQPDDSVRIAENYIRRWATDILLYDNAKHNIANTDEIDAMVEEYRKSLTIYAYEQQIVNQKMSQDVPEESLKDFYRQYAAEFPLQENILKGTLLVVPAHASGLKEVRQWMRRGKADDKDNIEKYALQHAVHYESFADRWTGQAEVARHLPRPMANADSLLIRGALVEVADSALTCLLYVNDARRAGQPKPYEYARSEMRDIIFNQNKVEYLEQLENDIYEDAVRDGLVNRITEQK